MYDWDKHFKEHGRKGTERKDSDVVERASITKIITTIIETYGRPVFQNKAVLDFGCGGGRFARMFLKAGCLYSGIDIVKSNVEFCKRDNKHPKAAFYLIDQRLKGLHFEAGSLDVIFTSTVLQHIHDLTAVQREFERTLVGGGALILFENTSNGAPDSEFITFRTFGKYKEIFDFVDLKRKIDIIDIAGEKHTLMIGRKK